MSKAEDPSVQGSDSNEFQRQPAHDDDDEDLIPPPAVPTRNKTPSRCYYASFIVVYFVLLIMAVVALGSFGAKQADINTQLRKGQYSTAQSCVLFTEYRERNGIHGMQLHANEPCGYVFYGLVSVTIVAFVWLVGSIVQTAIGPKVISLLRILDLVIMGLMFLLSLSLSATITIGLDATCNAFLKADSGHTDCQATGFKLGDKTALYYYNSIHMAKSSSWAMTVLLLALCIWYIILCISYYYTVKRRRQQRSAYQDKGNIRPVLV